jgi:hypothetical protein
MIHIISYHIWRFKKFLQGTRPKKVELILFQADAGFAVPALYRYLERQEIRYALGFITNNRVLAQSAPLLLRMQREYQETGEKRRLFTSFSCQTESWTPPHRIIAKVEYAHPGSNQRFVVNNLSRNPPFVYDDIYVLRGDVENRTKELKLEFKADRLSYNRFLANQFRLLLHTAAYCLFWLLRHHLQGTEMATAQVITLLLKLLKIGTASGSPVAASGCTWSIFILTAICWRWCCKTCGPAPVNHSPLMLLHR